MTAISLFFSFDGFSPTTTPFSPTYRRSVFTESPTSTPRPPLQYASAFFKVIIQFSPLSVNTPCFSGKHRFKPPAGPNFPESVKLLSGIPPPPPVAHIRFSVEMIETVFPASSPPPKTTFSGLTSVFRRDLFSPPHQGLDPQGLKNKIFFPHHFPAEPSMDSTFL